MPGELPWARVRRSLHRLQSDASRDRKPPWPGRRRKSGNKNLGRRRKVSRLPGTPDPVAAHELRSPLTVIRGNLELWRRARTDEERATAITAIEQETGRMTRLVENLLFLAQVEGEFRHFDRSGPFAIAYAPPENAQS